MALDLRKPKLSLGQRLTVAAMNLVERLGYHVSTPFHEDYVRTYGAWEYLKWLNEAFRITRMLESRHGKVEAQMIISMAGLWTGCRWCSITHMLIANLELFDANGELGPIDELELPRWQELRDAEVLEQIDRYMVGRWAHMAPLARRMYDLRTGAAKPSTNDDYLLLRTNVMWEWVIECTIVAYDFDPETIPAFGRVARDRSLLERYRQTRGKRGGAP